MRIYVSHPSAMDYRAELYAPLRSSDLDKQHTFVLPHERSSHPEDFPTRDLLLTAIDLLIVEASLPATGSGIELGWADSAGVPILALHREGVVPSSSVRTVAHRTAAYDSTDALLRHICRFIAAPR